MTQQELEIAFDNFYQANNGKPFEVVDPSNLDQCFDLAAGWCNAIGVPIAAISHLYAYQIWAQPNDLTVQYFDFIPNTPNGIPSKGAVVVFGTTVGPAGHVSVGSGVGDANTFRSFDENWNTAKDYYTDPKTGAHLPYCHFVTHAYDGVLGWLRPKVDTTPVAPTGPSYSQDELNAISVMEEALKTTKQSDGSGFSNVEGMERAIVSAWPSYLSDEQAISQLNSQITSLKAEVEKLNAIISSPANPVPPPPPSNPPTGNSNPNPAPVSTNPSFFTKLISNFIQLLKSLGKHG